LISGGYNGSVFRQEATMLLLVSDYLARVPYFFKKFDKKMTNPNIYNITAFFPKKLKCYPQKTNK